MILFQADDISVRFGGIRAVDAVSFDVRRGEVFSIIGPNGAGKTTIFNLISRIYTPTSGKLILEDKDFTRRVKKGSGADMTASGATRVAGSLNFKDKYAPNFPRVAIRQVNLGRVTTSAALERLTTRALLWGDELLRAPDPVRRAVRHPAARR